NSSDGDYLCAKIATTKLTEETGKRELLVLNRPGKTEGANEQAEQHFFYPDAWKELDVKAGAPVPPVAVVLRRATLKGRLVGPDGKPVTKALMFFRHPAPVDGVNAATGQAAQDLRRYLMNDGLVVAGASAVGQTLPATPIEVRDGQFEVSLRDLDAPYRLFFL